MRTSFGGQRGVGATEYAILVILAAVVIITVVSRFGKTVGGKVDSTRKTVQKLGDQDGHIVERESAPSLGEDEDGHIVERSPSSASGTKPDTLPDVVDEPKDRGIDTRFFILLGFGGLVIALILMAIAKRRPKDPKPSSPPPELRKEKTESYKRKTNLPQ